LVTKYIPRAGLFLHDLLRLALGADEQHVPPLADGVDDEVVGALEERVVWSRSMMWMPLRAP
jgi:hypothetical protein